MWIDGMKGSRVVCGGEDEIIMFVLEEGVISLFDTLDVNILPNNGEYKLPNHPLRWDPGNWDEDDLLNCPVKINAGFSHHWTLVIAY